MNNVNIRDLKKRKWFLQESLPLLSALKKWWTTGLRPKKKNLMWKWMPCFISQDFFFLHILYAYRCFSVFKTMIWIRSQCDWASVACKSVERLSPWSSSKFSFSHSYLMKDLEYFITFAIYLSFASQPRLNSDLCHFCSDCCVSSCDMIYYTSQ